MSRSVWSVAANENDDGVSGRAGHNCQFRTTWLQQKDAMLQGGNAERLVREGERAMRVVADSAGLMVLEGEAARAGE